MARFIGYPTGQILSVFDSSAAADAAIADIGVATSSAPSAGASVGPLAIERFEGLQDADRFDATGARHGLGAKLRRVMQFSLMDQLPAMAWYEAALRDGKTVVAVHTRNRPETLRAVAALKGAGGHFINRFGRVDTEEFARWHGPEPRVTSLMKH